MTQKNIEHLTNKILSGNNIFTYENIRYESRKPSLELRVTADLLYEDIYNENLFSDFLLLEDIPNISVQLGLIPYHYDKDIKNLEKKLENYKVDYFLFFSDIDARKKNKLKISTIKKQYSEYLEKIHYLDYISLEHYCGKLKNEFIIVNTLYYFETKKPVFENKDNIDYIFFNSLVHELSRDIIDIDTYKEICRSEYWKNLWANNKHTLIKDPVVEWSEEQKTLCNLSKMYDRIYEHPECPSDEIINDNDALDGWMIHQRRENSKQKQEKGVNSMLSDKVKNSSEIFLMANNKEKADSILEFNSKTSLNQLQQKINFVKSNSGPVKEYELPDVQQKISQQRRGK